MRGQVFLCHTGLRCGKERLDPSSPAPRRRSLLRCSLCRVFGLEVLGRVMTEVRRDVGAARERDPAARDVGPAEILAAWPGVHALLSHRVAHRLHEARVPVAPRVLATATRALTGIEIHPAAQIGARFFVDHGSGVVVGETAEIGDNVTLYQGVTLGGTGFATGKRHPTIEDNVTIGSGAKLLGPITIGHGAKVGANSVVITDVPPHSTVVGNPGHPVRVEGRRPEGPDADWIHLPDPIAEAIKALSGADRRARAPGGRAVRHRAATGGRGAAAASGQGPQPGGRLRRALVIVPLALLALAAPAAAKTFDNPKGTLTVPEHSSFTIALDSKAGTGFTWKLTKQPNRGDRQVREHQDHAGLAAGRPDPAAPEVQGPGRRHDVDDDLLRRAGPQRPRGQEARPQGQGREVLAMPASTPWSAPAGGGAPCSGRRRRGSTAGGRRPGRWCRRGRRR